MKWNIVTDSSCDLFPEVNGVQGTPWVEYHSVPFSILIGGKEYIDDAALNVMDMVDAMEQEKSVSHTACPSPEAWKEQFLAADYSIAITISSQLSGSMNSALTGREMALEEDPTKKIAILDSKSTGPKLVLAVEAIREMITAEAEFDEVVTKAEEYVHGVKTVFALSSFENLVKNGRMSKIAGFVAKTLGMWGVGRASEQGTIEIAGKTRGAKKMVDMLIHYMKEQGFSGHKVVISHCENPVVVADLTRGIQNVWKEAQVEVLSTRGLCSFYAERGGLIISY